MFKKFLHFIFLYFIFLYFNSSFSSSILLRGWDLNPRCISAYLIRVVSVTTRIPLNIVESRRFELLDAFTHRLFSKQVQSTTLPTLYLFVVDKRFELLDALKHRWFSKPVQSTTLPIYYIFAEDEGLEPTHPFKDWLFSKQLPIVLTRLNLPFILFFQPFSNSIITNTIFLSYLNIITFFYFFYQLFIWWSFYISLF